MAFSIGLLGSIHCVGMCGGIVAALSMGKRGAWLPGILSYHSGRILTYSILGLMAGLAGDILLGQADLMLAQRALSLLAGCVMIFFGLQVGGFISERFLPALSIPVTFLRRAVEGGSFKAWGMVGMANGLLPCGMVYAALSISLKQGSALSGMLTMTAFGLGTVPAMTGLAIAIRKLNPVLKGKVMRAAAIVLIFFGAFTIYRGLAPMRSHGEQQNVEREEKHRQGGIDHMSH